MSQAADAGTHTGLALAIAFGAAASTTIGAGLAMGVKRDNKLVLAGSLSVSAGVLIYVSLMDVMNEAKEAFERVPWIGPGYGPVLASTIFFFVGIGVVAALDLLTHHLQPEGVPGHATEADNGDSVRTDSELAIDEDNEEHAVESDHSRRRKVKLSVAMVVTAIAVAVHNFPEGIATYLATVRDPKSGFPIAFAIAVHNIPEGLCVAMPIFYATGSRVRAVVIAAGTGMLEFIGALVAWALPRSLFSDFFFGAIFAGTAGMMLFVSFVELLPVARQHDPDNKVMTKALFVGMLVMATSLILLAAAGLS